MKSFLKVFVVLFIFSFIFGCYFFISSEDYEKIADKITEKTLKELKTQKNLYLVGIGGQMTGLFD